LNQKNQLLLNIIALNGDELPFSESQLFVALVVVVVVVVLPFVRKDTDVVL